MVTTSARTGRAPRMRVMLALALAGAGWAALFLHGVPVVGVVVPAVFAAGTFLMCLSPVLGATVICVGQGSALALGAPAESPAGLVAGLSAMVILGRRSRLPHALLPVLLAWADIVATDITPVRQVLGLGLFAAGYGVGYTLRRSAEDTRLAEAEARELETEEVASRAAKELAAEHRRLTARSARLLRAATLEMRELAGAARDELDVDLLARLRDRGNSAVDELRLLLGLLREPAPGPVAPGTAGPDRLVAAARPRWHADAMTAVVLLVLAVLEWVASGPGSPFPGWLTVTIAAVALHRSWPALACLGAAAGLVLQRVTGDGFVLGPALALAVVLVVWSAVGATVMGSSAAHGGAPKTDPAPPPPATVWHLGGVVVLAGAGVLATAPARDSSLEVWLAIVLGTALSSRVWHRIRAQHAAARSRSTTYTRRLAMAVEAAIQQERLAVARDLHDVASGAIGVMLLHTAVAEVARTTAPAKAREALDAVVAAGDDALEDLDRLEHALGPGPDTAETFDLPASLAQLAQRMSRAGLDVAVEVEAAPRLPAVAAVTWRIVNEGLTNALKHAPGSRVRVSVRRDDDDVVVRVRDDGGRAVTRGGGTRNGRSHNGGGAHDHGTRGDGDRGRDDGVGEDRTRGDEAREDAGGRGGAGGSGTGLGLVGLGEQVERHGGTLRFGPLPGGGAGFELKARIPDPVPLQAPHEPTPHLSRARPHT